MTDRDSTPRVALYARVSTLDQSTDSQLLDLRRYVSDRGWQIFREYVDEGVSGTKEKRPALNELMNDAKKRRFDGVLVWRFDRFARSTKHLIDRRLSRRCRLKAAVTLGLRAILPWATFHSRPGLRSRAAARRGHETNSL